MSDILLVDDDVDSPNIIKALLRRAGVHARMSHVSSAEEGQFFLAHAIDMPELRPRVLLLDLNMPGKDGFDLLTWIRKQPAFDCVFVSMLTSSNREDDVRKAVQLGADAYAERYPTSRTIKQIWHAAQDAFALALPPLDRSFRHIPLKGEPPPLLRRSAFLTA
jgi:CheY-like chemotaxis protein